MEKKYDVIVLGSGLSGTILSTALAKLGHKILILDKASHPRFTVGESSIPYTTQILAGLSDYYDIPELSPKSLRKTLNYSCGVKENFSFIYQRPGKNPENSEINMLNLGAPEFHFFRSDVDHYLLNIAIQYGVSCRHNVKLQDVSYGESCIRLSTSCGDFEASYVVDGSGHDSLLARKFDLREKPTHLESHTRSLFTHMVDVQPADELMPAKELGMPGHFHKGTLHHVFDGGWIWVIPFNNHDESTNPLVSIGLQLDTRMYPEKGEDPELEFFEFISRFPMVEKQFRNAKAVRPWVSTDRLQYSSVRGTGDRFCLLPHAYGFIDPLFSRGLALTMDGIKMLIPLLDRAIGKDDFAESNFQPYERLLKNGTDFHDLLVAGAMTSFRDYALWHAWFSFWGMSGSYGEMEAVKARLKMEDGDPQMFNSLTNAGLLEEWSEITRRVGAIIRDVREARIDVEPATASIKELLKKFSIYPPILRNTLLDKGYLPPDPGDILASRFKALFRAPQFDRDYLAPVLTVKGYRMLRYTTV